MNWTWEQIDQALNALATDDISRLATGHLIEGLRLELPGLTPEQALGEVLSTAALIGSHVLATGRPRPAGSFASSRSCS